MPEILHVEDEITRIRRARALICYWKDERLIVENYLTHRVAAVDPSLLRVLHVFEEWQQTLTAVQALAEYPPADVRKGISELIKRGFLLRENSEEATRDQALAQVWADWLPHGCFHFATKDMSFLGEAEKQQLYEKYLASSLPPPVFKAYPDASRFQLPQVSQPEGELQSLLLRRRTHRNFCDRELPLTALSELLHYTWGVVHCEETQFGPQIYKTSPSGGARHPIEVYLNALSVAGLDAGLYHYNAKEHSLELIRQGLSPDTAVEYCAGQEHVRHASALFVMTAAFPRSMWKYRFARAYRVVTLDAGHLGQTFCLLATHVGLAPFCTAALNDSLIERELGLDGISESVIYVVGVGALPA